MLDSVLPTPVKLTYSEILLGAAATLAFQAIEKSGRPIVRLSELSEKPQYGYTAPAQAEPVGPRFLRITDIKAGIVDWSTVPYCDCPEPEKYLLKTGDILVARSGSVGKSFLVSECPEPTVFASYMIRMRARRQVLAGYIYWFLQARQFWLQVKESKRGSAMKNINSRMLSAVSLPDATSSQQNALVLFLTWFRNRLNGDCEEPPPDVSELCDMPRIVARIEELAALIREAQGLRVKAREEAEALVSSALSQIFDYQANDALPGGWTWCLLEELLIDSREGMKTGPFGTLLQKSEIRPEGVPVLGIANVQANRFVPGFSDYVSSQKAKELSSYKLQEGDVVVARSGTVGRSCLIPLGLDPPPIMSTNLIRLRLNTRVFLPDLLCRLFNGSRLVERHKGSECRGSTRSFFTQRILSKLQIPIPPLSEQYCIVAYLEDLQAQVDELTALQDATQAELDALLPSVLDRAFRGEL